MYYVGVGDYCVVVSIEFRVGVEYFVVVFLYYFCQFCLQGMVGVYVFCYYQMFKVGLFQCVVIFNYQCIDDCIFKCLGDVGVGLFIVVVVVNGVGGEGFQVGEVEVQFWMVGYWLWEDKVVFGVLGCYF